MSVLSIRRKGSARRLARLGAQLGLSLAAALLASCGDSEGSPAPAQQALGRPAPEATGAAATDPAAPEGTLTVAAAMSLRELLESTAPAFSGAHGACKVRFSFDASSTLAQQIEEGAAFDVFVSADAETLDGVAESVREETRRSILGNRLVMIGRADAPGLPSDPAGLRGGTQKIAVVGPAVPAGKYTRACLQRLGLLEDLEQRFVDAATVKVAVALVECGATDCAFVYLTDARAAESARLLWTAPPEADPGVVYVAAALKRSDSRHANGYVEWLGSPSFRTSATSMGFLPPP